VDTDRFQTHSLRDPRLGRILGAALEAVEPGKSVRQFLGSATLPSHKRVFLLGIGKAAEPMSLSASEFFGSFAEALIITKRASSRPQGKIRIMESGHPVPDERSLAAGEAALDFVSRLREDDLLVCLISGGGSALLTAPHAGISLEDLQELTSSLLACGATIDEINTLRRQLDRVKGGGIARATKARVVSLILSDVIGDHLEAIASGPTAPNPTTGADAIAILEKYRIKPSTGLHSLLSTQPIFDESIFDKVQNVIIGNNLSAAQAAQGQAEIEGFHSEIISTTIQGEAAEAGAQLAKRLKAEREKKGRPFCLIGGGETTVTIKGNGRGGRNQELALAAVEALAGLQDILLVSLATDGDDGPTDAAGAVVNGETRQRAERLGMSAADHLSRNDAYPFFESLGDLLKPGYTGTNVNDLIFLFAF
jgi:glycerate 2-kinase